MRDIDKSVMRNIEEDYGGMAKGDADKMPLSRDREDEGKVVSGGKKIVGKEVTRTMSKRGRRGGNSRWQHRQIKRGRAMGVQVDDKHYNCSSRRGKGFKEKLGKPPPRHRGIPPWWGVPPSEGGPGGGKEVIRKKLSPIPKKAALLSAGCSTRTNGRARGKKTIKKARQRHRERHDGKARSRSAKRGSVPSRGGKKNSTIC